MLEKITLAMLIIGGWQLLMDAFFSIVLNIDKDSYRPDEKQTWLKDHSIRIVRLTFGLAFLMLGIIKLSLW